MYRCFVCAIVLLLAHPGAARDVPLTSLSVQGEKGSTTSRFFGHNPILVMPLGGESASDNAIIQLDLIASNVDRIGITFERADAQFSKTEHYFPPTVREFDLRTLPSFDGSLFYIAFVFVGENVEVDLNQFVSRPATIADDARGVMKFRPYDPRTINFMDGPVFRGQFIAPALLKMLLWLTGPAAVWWLIAPRSRRSIVCGAMIVLSCTWLLLDLVSSVNDIRIWRDFKSRPAIENSRVGQTDFPAFLEFARSKIQRDAKAVFITPYPFGTEGPFHAYPPLPPATVADAAYAIVYRETANISDGTLTHDGVTRKIIGTFEFAPHAQIHHLKSPGSQDH